MSQENNKNTKTAHFPIVNTPSLDDISKHYQQGNILFEEGLKQYSLAINKIQSEIDMLEKESQKEEQVLLGIETEMHHESKLLERFHKEFEQKVHSIDELKSEYKSLVEDATYNKMLETKKKSLLETLDEIEEYEAKILTQELEHLNFLAKLEPKRKTIATLKVELNALRLEKEYFSTSKLQNIPQLNMKNENKEIVDIDVVKS